MRYKLSTICWVVAILFAVCFVVVGCEQGYRMLGYTDAESYELAARDRQHLYEAIGQGLAGIDADKEIRRLELLEATQETQAVFWKWVSLGISFVGTVGSAYLAKLFGREKKTVKAVVTGVENGDGKATKRAIEKAAIAAGVEDHLHTVVKKLTG